MMTMADIVMPSNIQHAVATLTQKEGKYIFNIRLNGLSKFTVWSS